MAVLLNLAKLIFSSQTCLTMTAFPCRLSAHEILFGKKSSMDDEEDTDDSDDSEMDAPNYLLMTMKKPWKPAASPRNT